MRRWSFAVAAIVLLIAPSYGSAQQASQRLEAGTWSGTVIPPGAEAAPVTFAVSYVADTLKIELDAGDHGKFAAYDAKFEGGKVTFKFRPGPEVLCVLDKKDNGYAGACTDEGGEAASIDMIPPRKQ